MKHLIYIALFFIGMQSVVAQSADLQARTHYLEAEAAYKNKDYSKTLTSLEETAILLKKTNARIEALRIKTYTDMGNISEARKSLTVFSGFTADYSLYQELNPYIERIEQAEQKQFEAEQQVLQQEAEKQERQFRVQELLGQVIAKIEEDKLDDATSLLTQAKQLNTESEGKQSISQVENYLNEIKEEKSLYRSALLGGVTELRAYLQRFPDHENAVSITNIFNQKEQDSYNKALTSVKIADYESYLRDFPSGKYKSEMEIGLAQAMEKEAYQKAVSFQSVTATQEYLSKYPNGTYQNEVKQIYEEALYRDANDYFSNERYADARSFYQRYKSDFPNGKYSSEVDSSLKKVERRIRKRNRSDSTYFMLTYSTAETFGFEIGKLNSSARPSVYLGINTKGLYDVSFSPDVTVQTLTPELEKDLKRILLNGNFGLTLKVAHPIWIYAGAGAIYEEYFREEGSKTYRIQDLERWRFYPEAGLKLVIGRTFTIKTGMQFIPNEESPVIQFGLGITG